MTQEIKSREILELEALDKLLNQAPPVPASPNLKNQILAAARNSHSKDALAAAASAEILQFRPKASPSPALSSPAGKRFSTGNLLAGGLLAASLVLGVWTGTTGFADSLIAAPLELAGVQSPASDGFDVYGLIDELANTGSLL